MNFDEKGAYWLGLVHADGFISKYMIKGKTKCELGLETISEILIKEFQKGLKIFGRNVSILKTKRNTYKCKISAKSIENVLSSMNITLREQQYKPTNFICKNERLFGAYLAGVIDGDGDIRIKRKMTYPQCAIRITSGSIQPKLRNLIAQNMRCSVAERHRIVFRNNKKMQWYELEFLISPKNMVFIKNYVLPNIKLPYKKGRIQDFIESRDGSLAGRTRPCQG